MRPPRPESWDLLAWPAGGSTPPRALAYGVTVTDDVVKAELVTVVARMRRGPKRVVLYRGDPKNVEKCTVTIDWDECLKPARWGDATFRLA